VVRVVTAAAILIEFGGLGRMNGADRRDVVLRRFGFVGFLQIIDDRLNNRWSNDGWFNCRGLLVWFVVHSSCPF
jgi:hypothetical protein